MRDRIVILEWVYARLYCEFDHWDICLTGLVQLDENLLFCKILSDSPKIYKSNYLVSEVNWTPECLEYLDDYRNAFPHWFYTNGERPRYSGVYPRSFTEKWQNRNPITEQFKQ